MRQRWCFGVATLSLFPKFEFTVDFHRYSVRQGTHADSRTHMAPVFRSEQLVDQIGGPIDYAGLQLEIRRAIDHADKPDHALDPVEIAAAMGLGARQHGKHRMLCRLVAFFQRHLDTDLAGAVAFDAIRQITAMARDEQNIADLHTSLPIGRGIGERFG